MQRASTGIKVLCNKLTYAFVRTVHHAPEGGWLHSDKHWYHFPFSLRDKVLWSPFFSMWFYATDDSAMECMLHLPDYEPVNWVAPKPGDVFLDLGPYIGPYSLIASRAVGASGRVIALEPDGTNRRHLENNLALNEAVNCTVIPKAAWSRSGEVGWYHGAQPVWHRVNEGNTTETVEAVSVDDLVTQQGLERVNWMKLDIEGGEVEALKGAERTLRTFRPKLFIEVHKTDLALRKLLESSGYCVDKASYDEPPDLHGWILALPKAQD